MKLSCFFSKILVFSLFIFRFWYFNIFTPKQGLLAKPQTSVTLCYQNNEICSKSDKLLLGSVINNLKEMQQHKPSKYTMVKTCLRNTWSCTYLHLKTHPRAKFWF